jgi:hypothetical protein
MSTNPPQGPGDQFPPPPPGQPPVDPSEQPTQVQQPAGYGQPDPYQQPAAYAQQPAVDPVAASEKKRKQQLGILAAIAAVLIVVAFFAGKAVEKKNYDPGKDGYNEIYAQGQKAGTAAGTAAGQKAGEAQGTKSGEKSGTEKGMSDGADLALGGNSQWSTTTPYVVTMQDGPNSSVPFAVDSRTEMQQGTLYKVCNSGKGVCTTESGGTGSTGQ